MKHNLAITAIAIATAVATTTTTATAANIVVVVVVVAVVVVAGIIIFSRFITHAHYRRPTICKHAHYPLFIIRRSSTISTYAYIRHFIDQTVPLPR
jgi:hypothetical protein